MTIATFASDSAVAASSRVPAWVPQFLVRAVSAGLRQPVKWPFSSGLSQGRHRGQVPSAAPEGRGNAPAVGTPTQLDRPDDLVRCPQAVADASGAAEPCAVLTRDALAVHNQSLGTARQALSQGLTLRQKVVDVLLVAMWGALIPGLMWLGAMAGF